jgi:hypothetical protein
MECAYKIKIVLIVSVSSYGFHSNWSTLTRCSSWMIFRYCNVFDYVRCGLETSCTVKMQPEWLVGWLVDFWPIGWLSGCLVCCLLGWSGDWLFGCLLGSLLGWTDRMADGVNGTIRAACQGKYCSAVLRINEQAVHANGWQSRLKVTKGCGIHTKKRNQMSNFCTWRNKNTEDF